MNLSTLFEKIQHSLAASYWQVVTEDDYSDFKQLVCENPSGPLRIFTRLDILIMTPGHDAAESSGVCLCFLFYADPSKVVDMFRLGRIIRQDESHLLRSQCDSILNAAKIIPGNPSIKVSVRPKHQKIKFSEENFAQPAFMVELGYWLSREKFPPDRRDAVEVVHSNDGHDEQIIDDRMDAIYALQGSDLTETKDLLLHAVSDPNPQIRIAGLTVLSDYCDEKFLSLFQDALNDGDETVRRCAGEYLKAFRKHIRSGPVIKARQSVNDCLKNLANTNDVVREKAVRDLEGIADPRIIQPLLAIMKGDNDDRWCRWAAMNVLDKFDCPELLDEFYSILGDEQVGAEAAYKLGNKSDPIAHELLRKAFFSDDHIAQLSAARCVRCNDNRVLQEFCHMLGDSDPEYREAAVDRIHSLFIFRWRGEEQECSDNFDISEESIRLVVATLKTAAKDENKKIRGNVLESLCLIDKTQAAPVLMDALEEFIHIALDENYQGKIDPWDYDWFQSSLHHAIAILGDKSFCEMLIRLFESKCWDVKIEAATTLLNLGDNRAIGLLKEALNHKDWNVRVRAAMILFAHGDSRMWDMLVKALFEYVEDHTVMKQGIIDTLAKSGDPRTVDALCDLLNNAGAYSLDDMDLGRIITCLGELGDSRAIEPIKKWQFKELVNCDDDVVEKALKTLEE